MPVQSHARRSFGQLIDDTFPNQGEGKKVLEAFKDLNDANGLDVNSANGREKVLLLLEHWDDLKAAIKRTFGVYGKL